MHFSAWPDQVNEMSEMQTGMGSHIEHAIAWPNQTSIDVLD